MVRFYRDAADQWMASVRHTGGMAWENVSKSHESYVCRAADIESVEMIGTEEE